MLQAAWQAPHFDTCPAKRSADSAEASPYSTSIQASAVITSVAGLYYYLRVVVYVYMVPEAKADAVQGGRLLSAGLAFAGCALIVLWMGVLPGSFAALAQSGAAVFGR